MLKKKPIKLFKVKNCLRCPNLETRRTVGAGFALDYLCKAKGMKLIAGYVENASEEPKNHVFPVWCPLKEEKG